MPSREQCSSDDPEEGENDPMAQSRRESGSQRLVRNHSTVIANLCICGSTFRCYIVLHVVYSSENDSNSWSCVSIMW